MNRVAKVVRMQFVNRQTFIWIPLIVIGSATAISLAIFLITPNEVVNGVTQPSYGGAGQAPLWYFLTIGIQSLTLTFPFSQAMSVSRRTFFLGTMACAAISSAILATIFQILAAIERATDGFGTHGYTYNLNVDNPESPFGMWLAVFVIAVLFFTLGFWFATIYKRWNATVLTITIIGIVALLVLAAFLITRADAWSTVGEFFGDLTAFSVAGYAAIVTAVLAGTSFLTLRRTTP